MKIKINNLTWTVSLTTFTDCTLGLASPKRLTIELAQDAQPEVIKSTLIHEIVHAYLFSYGYTKPNTESEMLFNEEQVCDFIAMNIDNITDILKKIYKKLY